MRLLIVGLLASAVHMLASPADEVDPFIGTGRAGNCYPGAQAPFGMLSWSPTTTFDDAKSPESRPGYKYSRHEILGFALTHLSGVGCHAAQDLPLMAVTGDPSRSPVGRRDLYKSRFSHDNEQARPGYYSVQLEEGVIQAELAATERCGIARFRFNTGTPRLTLLLRPTENANGVSHCEMRLDPATRRLSGVVASGGFCTGKPSDIPYRLFFVMEFNRPLISQGFWRGEDRMIGAKELSDPRAAAWASFDGKDGLVVLVRVGISYVSEANALANLQAEIPDWDLDGVRARTRQAWDRQLSVLETEGSPEVRARLCTALYHTMLQPSILDDANGEYPGFDDKIRKVQPGHHKYANFSNWDTYRTSAPLLALLAPDRASDMAASLLLDSQQGAPHGLPNWGFLNREADTMPGCSGIPFVANVAAFGARGFDLAAMKEAMVRTADSHYRGGPDYLRLGYVPATGAEGDHSVSETIEYSIADYCVGTFCALAGDETGGDRFLKRSRNVLKLFDPGSGYLRPRTKEGPWVAPFDPVSDVGFTEGNSMQYTWSMPHLMGDLVAKIGGRDVTDSRLDEFMSRILTEGWNTRAPHFWLSNEPCFGVPTAYCWTGHPGKAQAAFGRIRAEFKDGPDGIPGDDDMGAMSSYYVFAELGLYPAIPGAGGFMLTGSNLQKAVLKLDGGKRSLTVSSTGYQGSPRYIRSVKVNGSKWRSAWLPLSELSQDSDNEISIDYVADPGNWATRESDAPPTLR